MVDTVFESDSILNTIKKSLDIAIDDPSFDTVLLLHINSVFSDLYQIGVGAYGADEFQINDLNDLWQTVLGSQKNLTMIKSYVNLRVRLLFDPPISGFTTTSFQSQIDKMEWRIRTATSSTPNTSSSSNVPVPGPIAGQKSIWDLTGLGGFPDDAPIGAVGIDLVSGSIWRKT